MYIEHLLVQLKQEQIEQMAREAWKYQGIKKESKVKSVFKRWFSRKPVMPSTCGRACVC
ncbi:hypothetical protein [Neobacillus notoginsengisoli]|uniref:hypothetical protein n=1 Tax=Neobacillus notoginsengisoli TaxID=1578198 RepID=UPI0013146360|nr:hypothetical protein [Neobacillus notoginsengisoli]